MLFKRAVLERIVRGEVTIAFRWWRRPTVRAGGRLMTPVGELAIDSVTALSPADITDVTAKLAGFRDRAEALAMVGEGHGQFYQIEFRWVGEDPRERLADCDELDANEIDRIRLTLSELDRRSRGRPWTDALLRLVSARPRTPAAELAGMMGVETLALKRRLRRLKALGLTHSLAVGYRLTRRGLRLLEGSTMATTSMGSSEP